MQLPTAAQRVHIIRASTHKNSEVKGGIRSPPDFTSKREREESPTAVCATAGSKVIEEPDIEPWLSVMLSNNQLKKLWL